MVNCAPRSSSKTRDSGRFSPKRHKTVRHARKLRHVDAAFFPRYLFVGLDLDRDRWRSVNGTYGVASLVMQNSRPHPVPRGVVEALIASADARGILLFGERLKVGGTIRLLAGAFAEQLATLESMDDLGRIRVLLENPRTQGLDLDRPPARVSDRLAVSIAAEQPSDRPNQRIEKEQRIG